MPPLPPPRLSLGFIMEQAMGHITHHRALAAAADRDPDVRATFMPVPYWSRDAWQRVPGVRSNLSLLLSLRARRLVRQQQKSGAEFDALLYHTQVTSLFSLRIMRQTPAVLSLDATPMNADPVAPARPCRWTRRPNGASPADRAKFLWVRATLRRAAALTAWSQWTRNSLVEDYGVAPEKVTVLPPGVDLAHWQPAPRPADTGRLPRLLFVGAQFDRKGGPLLLEAFAGALSGRAELDIVTPDPAVADDPGPGIRIHRGLSANSPELTALYAAADLFVLPTHNDCMPIAIMEAMAAGLPVVATDVGAIREQVAQDETGLLVPPGDGPALATAVSHLVEHPAQRRAMGQRARQRAEQLFDAGRNYARLIELIKTCARARRPRQEQQALPEQQADSPASKAAAPLRHESATSCAPSR